MALEAIKALFGGLPGEAGPLGGSPPPEDLARAARMRQRAWAFVSSQVPNDMLCSRECQRAGGVVVSQVTGRLVCKSRGCQRV